MKSARHLFATPFTSRTTGGGTQRSGRMTWFFQPVIAPILLQQNTLRIMSVIASFQLVVTMSGVQGWQYTFKLAEFFQNYGNFTEAKEFYWKAIVIY